MPISEAEYVDMQVHTLVDSLLNRSETLPTAAHIGIREKKNYKNRGWEQWSNVDSAASVFEATVTFGNKLFAKIGISIFFFFFFYPK